MEDINESVNNAEVADTQDNSNFDIDTFDWNSLTKESVEQEVQEEVKPEPVEDVKATERDLEKDNAFATMRRKQEELEKELAKYKQADEEFANKFREHDVKNANDYLIKVSEEENKDKKNQLQERLANGDFTAIDELIEHAVNPYKQSLAEQQAKVQQEKAFQQLQNEISELNTTYGLNVKSIDEIRTLPNGEKIVGYMEKSLSASEAYFLANKDTVKQDIAKQTKQATINQLTGTSHIKPNGSGVDVDEVVVPDGVIEGYRMLNPKMSLEEIKKDYKKYNK